MDPIRNVYVRTYLTELGGVHHARFSRSYALPYSDSIGEKKGVKERSQGKERKQRNGRCEKIRKVRGEKIGKKYVEKEGRA